MINMVIILLSITVRYCGFILFRWVLIFVDFVSSTIHEFKATKNISLIQEKYPSLPISE